jgi:hypothetical protein
MLIAVGLAPAAMAALWFAAYERTGERAVVGQVLAAFVVGLLTLAGFWTIFDAWRG